MSYEDIKMAAKEYGERVYVPKKFLGYILIRDKVFDTINEACEEAFKDGALTALTNQNKELEK